MKVDPSRTLASMKRVEKNVRFGIARGLTQTAKDAAAHVNENMERRFDRPTPFTKKATAFTPAKRDRLVASVFVKDVQADYLIRQEKGGQRRPTAGKPINVPVQQRLNKYGNIARGAVGRLRDKSDVFVSSGRRRGNAKHLPAGIYKRGRSKRRPSIKLLVAFEKAATYRPRFRFRSTVVKFARAEMANTIRRSIVDALRTAK